MLTWLYDVKHNCWFEGFWHPLLTKESYRPNTASEKGRALKMKYRTQHTHPHTPHTHTHTHTCTHTHVVFPSFMGTFRGHYGFYTIQTVFSIPLNLPLTQETFCSLDFQNLVLNDLEACFLVGTKNVPTRTRIWDIDIIVGTFCLHYCQREYLNNTHISITATTINIGKPFLSNRHIFLYIYDIYIMGFSCLPYKACDKKYRNLNFVVFILTSRGTRSPWSTPFSFIYKYKQIQIELRWALFVTYTIIQSIMRSEMCSLHLTHPSGAVHLFSLYTTMNIFKILFSYLHPQ